MYRLIVILTVIALAVTACGGQPASSAPVPAPQVQAGTSVSVILTSTTFLADMTRNIAGDRLTVESLLPAGADPHSYEPVPADVAKLSESKLLIVNGLEYEHFLDPLLKNAGGERTIITASDTLEPHTMEDEEGTGQMLTTLTCGWM